MRNNTIKFYRRVQARRKELYEVERKRYDDVIDILKEEFFKDEGTIHRILRTELPNIDNQSLPQIGLFAT
jgi:hypothetical protein